MTITPCPTHPYVCPTLFMCVKRRWDPFTCVLWLIHMCDMTSDSFICVKWLIHVYHVTHSYASVWHDAFICITRLVHMVHTIHSYVWHDSICMCDTTHSYVWRAPLVYVTVTWLSYMFETTRWYMRRGPLTCVPWLIHICSGKCCGRCLWACGTVFTKHVLVSFILHKRTGTHQSCRSS